MPFRKYWDLLGIFCVFKSFCVLVNITIVLFVGSTETKYIKLKTKTQHFFFISGKQFFQSLNSSKKIRWFFQTIWRIEWYLCPRNLSYTLFMFAILSKYWQNYVLFTWSKRICTFFCTCSACCCSWACMLHFSTAWIHMINCTFCYLAIVARTQLDQVNSEAKFLLCFLEIRTIEEVFMIKYIN